MTDGDQLATPSPPGDRFADDALAQFVGGLADEPPMSSVGDPVELRRQTAARSSRPVGPEMSVTDLSLPRSGLRARWYRPTVVAANLVVFLHGGGWTIGDLESHDRFAAQWPVMVLHAAGVRA